MGATGATSAKWKSRTKAGIRKATALPHRIHVWYICQHLGYIDGQCYHIIPYVAYIRILWVWLSVSFARNTTVDVRNGVYPEGAWDLGPSIGWSHSMG